MKINGVNEFFQFVRANGFVNLTPEIRAMIVCMEEYGRLCACDPDSVRITKFNQCKEFYITFVKKKARAYTNDLIMKVADGKIEFSNDGQYISTVSR
jgi:hypothetical protein